MAKLDGVIQFTGKLGQTVGVKGQDGRNVLRVRRNTIKNPKTDAQCAQRMICTTAAQAVSQLKQILNNSFEGKSFGAKSLQHARSLYMRMLRTVPSLDGNGMVYLPKGSLKFPVNTYPLSEGSLPNPGVSFDTTDNFLIVQSAIAADAIATATAKQAFPNVEVGHQITIVTAHDNGASRKVVSFCRFAFKDNTTPVFITSEGAATLNPAAIDVSLAEGNWDKLVFFARIDNILHIELVEFAGGNIVVGASLIVSDKAGGKRSSAFLMIDTDASDAERGGLSAAEAMPTYGDNAASLNLQSDYYLQNSLTPEAGE